MLSTEVYCFPKELETDGQGGVCTALAARAPPNTDSKYVNIGAFMGRADALLKLLKVGTHPWLAELFTKQNTALNPCCFGRRRSLTTAPSQGLGGTWIKQVPTF